MTRSRVVLVTGAAGALGSWVLPALHRRGWSVRALIHRRPVPDAAETVEGDISEATTLVRATAGVEAIMHLAGVTHARRPRDYYAANVTGTQNLLEAAVEAGVDRFLYVSTRTASERGGAYSDSKLRAEQAVRAAELRHTIVRLPEIYGGGSAEGVDRIIGLARQGLPIPLIAGGDARICPLYVEDAAEALAEALDEQPEDITYTALGECMTMREFAATCLAEFGSRSRLVRVPGVLVALATRVSRFVPVPVYPDQLTRLQAATESAAMHPMPWLEPRSVRAGLQAVGHG